MSIPRHFKPVVDFVNKSGGIDKVKAGRDALHASTAGRDCRGLLQRLADNPDPAGANQLVAAAILGFTLSAMMWEYNQRDAN